MDGRGRLKGLGIRAGGGRRGERQGPIVRDRWGSLARERGRRWGLGIGRSRLRWLRERLSGNRGLPLCRGRVLPLRRGGLVLDLRRGRLVLGLRDGRLVLGLRDGRLGRPVYLSRERSSRPEEGESGRRAQGARASMLAA
ncbi:MAG: hypothetical protein LBG06_06205 [Deltaproteobacteria bacterium]|nr:hypothetical protein [Deltaproteobacteria bacterium]